MSRPSLRRRALLVVAAYVVVIAGTAAIVMPQLLGVRERFDDRRDLLLPAQRAAASLRAAAVDQESGERGYLITGQEDFLDPYRAGRAAADAALAELRASSAPGLAPIAEAAASDLERWQTEAAEPEIAARRANNTFQATKLVATGKGKALFDAVRGQLDALDRQVQAELDRSSERLNDALDTLLACLAIGLIAAILLTVFVWSELRRWVTRPVEQLLDALRAVRDGDHDRTVPTVGTEELAEIGSSADEMRLRMLDELRGANRAREALEQTGPVVLLLRRELEPASFDLPDGLSFAGRFEPAEGILAGDFYDLVPVAGGRVAFVVADVSGHGAEAGVLAVRIKYLVAAALQMAMEPDAVLTWVAGRLGDTGDMFTTCVVLIADPVSGQCTYANAGHPDLLVCTDGELTRLGPTGPLLGPFPGTWGLRTLDVTDRTLLVGYTDGLLEARGPDGAEFGAAALEQLILDHCDEEPDVVSAAVLDTVRRFASSRIADDLTVGVITLDPDRARGAELRRPGTQPELQTEDR